MTTAVTLQFGFKANRGVKCHISTELSESRCALRLRQVWLSVLKLPLKCAIVSLYSVVKQLLKYNTDKMCNCLIKFLLSMFLSINERVFLVEYFFREGNRYKDLVQQIFSAWSSNICSVS
jgi:hypothetical protein